MDKTCSTCKYWVGGYLSYRQKHSLKNICDLANGNNLPDRVGLEILSYAMDDSGLNTELVTGPDFGCVNHSSK